MLIVSCVYSLRALLRLVGTNLVPRPSSADPCPYCQPGTHPSGSNDRAPMKILLFLHELALGGATVNAIERAASLRDRHGHDGAVFASPGPMPSVAQEAGLRVLLARSSGPPSHPASGSSARSQTGLRGRHRHRHGGGGAAGNGLRQGGGRDRRAGFTASPETVDRFRRSGLYGRDNGLPGNGDRGACIRSLAQSQPRRRDAGALARELVHPHFSLEAAAGRSSEICRAALASRPGPRRMLVDGLRRAAIHFRERRSPWRVRQDGRVVAVDASAW